VVNGHKSVAPSSHSFILIRQMAAVVIIKLTTFSCRSQTDSPDGETDIATLVRRALAEVCTVPVLLVTTLYLFLFIKTLSNGDDTYRSL